MTCVALYMLLMSFSQKGINKLRNFNEHLQMRDPEGELEVSEGFDEGPYLRMSVVLGIHSRVRIQPCRGSRTTSSSVTTARRWSRRGFPHNISGRRHSLTSSYTIVHYS